MIEAKQRLLNRFYQDFWALLILLILTVIVIVASFVFYLVKFKASATKFKVVLPIALAVLIGLTLFLCMIFARYYNDYLYLKTNEPVQIQGKVVEFSVRVSGDDSTVKKSWPIILVDETNEISLSILHSQEKLQINQTYEFLYLPNTRIAVIFEEK